MIVWDELAPHAMHEQNSYAEWAEKSGVPSPYSFYSDKNSLRDSGKYTVLTAEKMIDQFNTMHMNEPLIMSPLVGGLSPSTSWQVSIPSSIRCFLLLVNQVPVFLKTECILAVD